MADIETGVSFFVSGMGEFANVPSVARPFVFQVCSRQMILSASAAAETFQGASVLAKEVDEPETLRSIYQIAAEISRRSAKHSTEFLAATPASDCVDSARYDPPADRGLVLDLTFDVTRSAIDLTAQFAERAGGIAADAWSAIPPAIEKLDSESALKLMRRAASFLERGGGTRSTCLSRAARSCASFPKCFDDWIDLLWAVAAHGNAGLVAFIRASPPFFQTLAAQNLGAPQRARAPRDDADA